MAFGQAPVQSPPCAVYFRRLALTRLSENRQEDDAPFAADPVRQSGLSSLQVKPQFAQLAVELSRVGLTEQRSLLGQ